MDLRVTTLALASASLFGLALVLTQLGLRALPPLRGACISIPTTALLFLLTAPFTVDAGPYQSQSALLFAMAGLLFPAAVTLLTYEANRRLGPNLAGVLGNLTPLFAVLLAFLLLGEVPRAGQIGGVAVIVAGIAILMWDPRRAIGAGLGWAVALPLLAALIRGLVQPVIKLALEGWPSPFAAVLIGYLVSAAVVLSAGAIAEGRNLARLEAGWQWFVAVGVSNGLAVLTMYAALAYGSIAVVAPLIACYPLATLVFGRLVLGPVGVGWRVACGIAVTVLGVAVLLRG